MRRQNSSVLSDSIEDSREKTGSFITCPMFCFQVEADGTLLEFKGQKDSNLLLASGYQCDEIQGHLICPPVSSVSLAQFVREKRYLDVLKRTSTKE